MKLAVIKFIVYAALAFMGIAVAYRKVSEIIADGAPAGAFGWLSLAVWSAAIVYLSVYSFLLASALVFKKRHGIAWDVVAFVVFAVALFASIVSSRLA